MLEGLIVVLGLYHHIVVVGGNEPPIVRLPTIKITMPELATATGLIADLNGVRVADVSKQCGAGLRFDLPQIGVISIGAGRRAFRSDESNYCQYASKQEDSSSCAPWLLGSSQP